MMISYVSIGLLAMLVFGLGLNVSLKRMSTQRSVGVEEDLKCPLYRARVAHSNACEYCPMLAILIFVTSGSLGDAFALVAVAARYSHAVGILGFPMHKPNRFRYWGSVGTYGGGLALALTLLFQHLPL